MYFWVMQLLLPLFPLECKMISSCVGVYEKDGLVQYIVNGLPVFSHGKDDLQGFRFITSNFIRQGHSHKIRGAVLERIQKKLDKCQSVNSIAKEEKLTEGAIRYAITHKLNYAREEFCLHCLH